MSEDGANFQLTGIIDQLFFLGGDFLQLVAINRMRHGNTGLFDRQPDHWHQIGHQQNDVLGNLCPGHSAHSPQKRANQQSAQPEKNTQFKRYAGQVRSDESDAVNLCDQISK